MPISDLFNVFSKRSTANTPSPRALTETFRNRVLMRCRDLFVGTDFLDEIHSNLTYLHGRPRLSSVNAASPALDALAFLESCSDSHFLDFIEYTFKTRGYFHASGQANLVEDFNAFLQQDDLPYAITEFV